MFASETFPNRATLIAAAILAALPFLVHVTLATQIAIFATATLSVTMLLGSAGLLSFGQGLYFGVGSYLAGLLLREAGLGLLPAILVSTLTGAALAATLGALTVRREGVYFVMLTLAFAHMGYFAMLSLKTYTGGENGLSGLPRSFTAFGVTIGSPTSFYILAAAAFLVAFLAVQRVNASPFGSVLAAIRENPRRTEAMGYDVKLYKVALLAFAGAVAGLAGAMYAAYLGFVPPTNIELEMSQRLLVMAIIGGVQSPAGALVGAAFYMLASEVLSELWARWLALIAALLIAIVLYLPGGLWSLGRMVTNRLERRAADD